MALLAVRITGLLLVPWKLALEMQLTVGYFIKYRVTYKIFYLGG